MKAGSDLKNEKGGMRPPHQQESCCAGRKAQGDSADIWLDGLYGVQDGDDMVWMATCAQS